MAPEGPGGLVHSPNLGCRGLRVVDKTLAVFFYRRSCTGKRIITERRCCCCMLTVATCGLRSNPFTCNCRDRDKMLRYGRARRPVKFPPFSRIHVPCCQSNPIAGPKGHGTLVTDAWSIELLIYSIKSFIDPSADIMRQYMHTEEKPEVFRSVTKEATHIFSGGKRKGLRHAIVGSKQEKWSCMWKSLRYLSLTHPIQTKALLGGKKVMTSCVSHLNQPALMKYHYPACFAITAYGVFEKFGNLSNGWIRQIYGGGVISLMLAGFTAASRNIPVG